MPVCIGVHFGNKDIFGEINNQGRYLDDVS